MHRQLFEIETFDLDAEKRSAQSLPKPPKDPKSPGEDERQPLFEAIASRATDTALRGAAGLASLGDRRALGLLLQLSRDGDTGVRHEVCQRLATLGDVRAIDRLRTLLDDADAAVRGSAAAALRALQPDDPLAVAAVTLAASQQDVRRAGFEAVAEFLRRKKSNRQNPAARALLIQTLSDPVADIRREAFKVAINLPIEPKHDEALRFCLASSFHDIRGEVLTEAISRDKEPWAWPLVLEFLADAAPQLRERALEHAVAKTRRRDVEPLRVALRSPHADTRRRAVEILIKMSSRAAQEVLAGAVSDDDADVRLAALRSIIDHGLTVDRGAAGPLAAAMDSRHDDVRLAAAVARAAAGDAAALAPLTQIIGVEAPQDAADRDRWQKRVVEAIGGIAALGDPTAIATLTPLVSHNVNAIAAAAAEAIIHTLGDLPIDRLREWVKSPNFDVRAYAAVGLAIAGDASATTWLSEPKVRQAAGDAAWLAGWIALGPAGESRLVAELDSSTDWIGDAAALTLIGRDVVDHDGIPRRTTMALAAATPAIRLLAAGAAERFGDAAAVIALLTDHVNDREDKHEWKINAEVVGRLIAVLVHGPRPIRLRAVECLEHLADQPEAWSLRWRAFESRFADQIDAAALAGQTLPEPSGDLRERTEVAFGTYVGLVRDAPSKRSRIGSSQRSIHVRTTAVRRLLSIAGDDPARRPAAAAVLTQALGDPNAEVRQAAFDSLPGLGVDDATRASAGIESGQLDLAVAGMKLLIEGDDDAAARQILADAVTGRTDRLAEEAARLMAQRFGPIDAASIAVNAPRADLRVQAVRWLGVEYDRDEAKAKLGEAVGSKFENVRTTAAIVLAERRDDRAFTVLRTLIRDHQRIAVEGFSKLGNPAAAGVALSRIEDDPARDADGSMLLQLVASYRNPDDVPRLLALMDDAKGRTLLTDTVLTISGHDQPPGPAAHLDRPADDYPADQYPRHDAVLAALIDRHLDLESTPRTLLPLIAPARWSKTAAVDPALTRLTTHADDSLRHTAVQYVGWRVRHRASDPTPLLSALQHKNPTTQFLAAEGLALAGRGEGAATLMSAIELLPDLALRRRAVTAVGVLADSVALDTLIQLAGDHEHALQPEAAEAIGHLGASDRAGDIFDLLRRLASGDDSATENAVVGLRYFGTDPAWEILRRRAANLNDPHHDLIVRQLAHDASPATGDVLLQLLRTDRWQTDWLAAARRCLGTESLEPDYAVIGSARPFDLTVERDPPVDCVARVVRRGEPARIFEVLPAAEPDVRAVLVDALLRRDPPPVDAATEAITGRQPAAVIAAAGLLGRGGRASSAGSVETALASWVDRLEQSAAAALTNSAARDRLRDEINTVARLVWAAGRLSVAKPLLLSLATRTDLPPGSASIRRAAIEALDGQTLTAKDRRELNVLLTDPSPSIRDAAAGHWAGADLTRVSEAVLSDRHVLERLASGGHDVSPLIQSAATSPHHQAMVLRRLIAASDIARLTEVATDASLPDATRLGAIEAISRIPTDDATATLSQIAATGGLDEELTKATFRALRRCKRLQAAESPPNRSGQSRPAQSFSPSPSPGEGGPA